MLSLNKSDIRNLESLGSGAFGTVYRLDDNRAIKVYHETVESLLGNYKKNPQLKKIDRALRIKRIGKKIEHSDLIQDLLYLDGNYAGIVIPFYDGVTLNNMMDVPIDLKVDISKQLIRNCEELTSNNIYPLDFKLNNIIYVDGEVKILDLDDTFTKYYLFKNERQRRRVVIGLDETIKTYFSEYRYSTYNSLLRYYLTRKIPEDESEYSEINNYVEKKEEGDNYLFIDINSDIDIIKSITNSGNYKIIILYDHSEYDVEVFAKYLDLLERNGIYVYDILRRNEFDFYFNNNKINNKKYIKGNSII